MCLFQPVKIGVTSNIWALLLLSVSFWAVSFLVASAAEITSFKSDIYIENDGSLTITETIVYDFGEDFKHGIFRNISDTHAQDASSWYKDRYLNFELLSVHRDGISEVYKIEPYDGISVKIGDPYKTITGEHTYAVKYRVLGALSVFENEKELYWNVTGDKWDVPLKSVQAIISAPPNTLQPTRACYADYLGESTECSKVEEVNGGVVFSQNNLIPGQQLTIAQSISLTIPVIILEKNKSWLLKMTAILIWLIGLSTWAYRWRTKYRLVKTVVAQYEPLPDFKPMFTGVLFDNRLDSRDISACIVYLAEQGFISIHQTSEKILGFFNATDYEVKLLRTSEEIKSKFQREVLTLIFGSVTNQGAIIKLSDLRTDSAKLYANATTITTLKKTIIDELIKLGLLEQKATRVMRVFIFVILFGVILFLLPLIDSSWFLLAILLVLLSVATILIFGMERRTVKGFEVLNYLKGFKEFLSVTEKDRYKFHNAPNLNPQQFMEYLPYAIAFGVEKQWAEVFRDFEISNPAWYSSADSVSTFNTVTFSRNIGSFTSVLAGSTRTSSSGSSGGGSAGGGSGGGGGGSW